MKEKTIIYGYESIKTYSIVEVDLMNTGIKKPSVIGSIDKNPVEVFSYNEKIEIKSEKICIKDTVSKVNNATTDISSKLITYQVYTDYLVREVETNKEEIDKEYKIKF